MIFLYRLMYSLLAFYWYKRKKKPDSHKSLSYIAAAICISCLLSAVIMNKILFFIAAVMWAILSVLEIIMGDLQ